MEYSWFLAGLLMAVLSNNNTLLIIHLLIECFLISYQVSITEPFGFLTMSAQSTFTHPFAFVLTDQTTFQDWLVYFGCLKYANQQG